MIKASRQGNPKAVKMLIKYGANVDAVNKKGSTSLMYASEKNSSNSFFGFTSMGSRADYIAVVEALIEAGASLDITNKV